MSLAPSSDVTVQGLVMAADRDSSAVRPAYHGGTRRPHGPGRADRREDDAGGWPSRPARSKPQHGLSQSPGIPTLRASTAARETGGQMAG